jgi:exodeoxyribonuclease III
VNLATFNINGINGRRPVLLRWLKEARIDAVCLQELKAPDDKFPRGALEDAGYGALWHGQKSWTGVPSWRETHSPSKLARSAWRTDDRESRYIEAAVQGMMGVATCSR